MQPIELKFIGTEKISKQKPFEDSEFIYLNTETIFKDKLPEIIESLKKWSIDEHQCGDAYFADAMETGDRTVFSLRMNYRTMPPLSKKESTRLLYDIIESFNLFLNEIEWLKG